MATIDVTGLEEDKVEYLQTLIAQWRHAEETIPPIESFRKRQVHPSEFIVKKSYLIDGKVTRAMAYEDE